jgi:transcriptional regulator with XRE-family HTH domain
MGIIGDGLDRAVQQAFTRPIPKSVGAQMRYLVKQLKGTRAVADLLGVSQRTVERYVKDQIRPRAELAQRIEDAVRQRWQPRIRAQARKQAATSTGLVLDARAGFGFTAAPGTTDDARIRHLTLALPPHHAARLFNAQDQGAGEQQLRALAAEALGEVYFRDGAAPQAWRSSSRTSSTSSSTCSRAPVPARTRVRGRVVGVCSTGRKPWPIGGRSRR